MLMEELVHFVEESILKDTIGENSLCEIIFIVDRNIQMLLKRDDGSFSTSNQISHTPNFCNPNPINLFPSVFCE